MMHAEKPKLDDLKKKVILVTGGAGFIGSHLCRALLNRDAKVINLDNFSNNYPPVFKKRNIAGLLSHPAFHLYNGDIRDYRLLEMIHKRHPITEIIHLAALAGVRKSISDPLEYVDIDIKGTVNLLEFAAKHKPGRFIFASSSSVYGAGSLPFRETDRVDRPVSPYAAAKRAGELFGRTYYELYNIPVACLRFFTVYGPCQRPDMAVYHFTRLIDQNKEVPVFGLGKIKRDFTYVDDVVEGIIKTLSIPLTYALFNLGTAKSTSLLDLIEMISNKLGKKARITYYPLQPGDAPETLADLTHSSKTLGFKPTVSLDDGIKSFISWYRRIKK